MSPTAILASSIFDSTCPINLHFLVMENNKQKRSLVGEDKTKPIHTKLLCQTSSITIQHKSFLFYLKRQEQNHCLGYDDGLRT